MSKDKTKLKILNVNKMKNPMIICPSWCYKHSLISSYELIKKINQSKFLYECKDCKRKFIAIIKLPLMTCSNCNSINHIDRTFFYSHKKCTICHDTGILSWDENVFGKDCIDNYNDFANIYRNSMYGNLGMKTSKFFIVDSLTGV